MSMAHLGPSFDIHTGGVDLVFPHHEDEIAQSRGGDRPAVRAHVDALRPPADGRREDGEVHGNIARVADLLAAGVSPRALRYALIAVHYRAALKYTRRVARRRGGRASSGSTRCSPALEAYREDRADDRSCRPSWTRVRAGFEAALDDDLNVSAALAALFDGIRELNRRIDARSLSTADAGRALAGSRDLDAVLGVLRPPRTRWSPSCGDARRARGGTRRARLGRIRPAA